MVVACSGFDWSGTFDRRDTVRVYLANVKEDAEALAFGARLHAASTTRDIEVVHETPLPLMRKPPRMVLRELLLELLDRFPAAEALIRDLMGRI